MCVFIIIYIIGSICRSELLGDFCEFFFHIFLKMDFYRKEMEPIICNLIKIKGESCLDMPNVIIGSIH